MWVKHCAEICEKMYGGSLLEGYYLWKYGKQARLTEKSLRRGNEMGNEMEDSSSLDGAV